LIEFGRADGPVTAWEDQADDAEEKEQREKGEGDEQQLFDHFDLCFG
jgi:hypothetical protein